MKLQKAYKNEHDEGLTYIGPFGTIQLTPAMVLDWSHALVCHLEALQMHAVKSQCTDTFLGGRPGNYSYPTQY